jgi:hypothetical protein
MNWTGASPRSGSSRCSARPRLERRSKPVTGKEQVYEFNKESGHKAIVDRWFTEFWGKSWNQRIVDELGAPDIVLQYLLQAPRRGRANVKTFMTEFREAFPDLSVTGAEDFVCEGNYVVGRWEGWGTHTGPAYYDELRRAFLRFADGAGEFHSPGLYSGVQNIFKLRQPPPVPILSRSV